ncbi:MAG: hypothetical protein GZ091_08715 [Paludibacter sp.]|nr:hypothetical protein [Paludibacter sp.]
MNGAQQNGNEFLPKLCGAEVYDWNDSENGELGFVVRNEQETRNAMKHNGNHIPQAHV